MQRESGDEYRVGISCSPLLVHFHTNCLVFKSGLVYFDWFQIELMI